MFLKNSKFKALLSEAYKINELRVGNDGTGIYIAGTYWCVWVNSSYLPNREKANIIELVGELPEKDEQFVAGKKTDIQYEIAEKNVYNAMTSFLEAREENLLRAAVVTPMILENKSGTMARVLQNPNTCDIRLVNEFFVEMVDVSEIDKKNGEDVPGDPYIEKDDIYWQNNTMILKVRKRTDDRKEELLKYLESIDLRDKEDN